MIKKSTVNTIKQAAIALTHLTRGLEEAAARGDYVDLPSGLLTKVRDVKAYAGRVVFTKRKQ